MYWFAEKTFYALTAVILGSAFFVMQPSQIPDTSKFQTEVKNEFAFAAVQVFGDNIPIVENVKLVVSSINQFYVRSADALIVLLQPTQSQEDLIYVTQTVYNKLTLAFAEGFPQVSHVSSAQTIVREEPQAPVPSEETQINFPYMAQPQDIAEPADTTTAASYPVANDEGNPWVNLKDNTTGQIYCVAIYNAEVNRYLGPCKNDYH